jgi:hypothetical protein
MDVSALHKLGLDYSVTKGTDGPVVSIGGKPVDPTILDAIVSGKIAPDLGTE